MALQGRLRKGFPFSFFYDIVRASKQREEDIMKILLLGDLHTGIGNDDPWVHEYILDTIKKAVDYSKAKFS